MTDIPNYTIVLQDCLDKIQIYGVFGSVEDVRKRNKSTAKVFLRAAVAGYFRSLGYSYEKIGHIIARRPNAVQNLLKKAKRITSDQRKIVNNVSSERKRERIIRELIHYHESQIKMLKEKLKDYERLETN